LPVANGSHPQLAVRLPTQCQAPRLQGQTSGEPRNDPS
jgi:hypothetical protein